MKKIIFVLLISLVLVFGCINNTTNYQTNIQDNNKLIPDSNSQNITNNLDNFRKAKTGDTVVVDYTGSFENGEIFDSSLTQGRAPLEVKLGNGEVIKGFENAIIGMKAGEEKRVEISPSDGYGDIIYLDRNVFADQNEINAGAIFSTDNGVKIVILSVDENKIGVTDKINYSNFIGKTLIFTIKLVAFK